MKFAASFLAGTIISTTMAIPVHVIIPDNYFNISLPKNMNYTDPRTNITITTRSIHSDYNVTIHGTVPAENNTASLSPIALNTSPSGLLIPTHPVPVVDVKNYTIPKVIKIMTTENRSYYVVKNPKRQLPTVIAFSDENNKTFYAIHNTKRGVPDIVEYNDENNHTHVAMEHAEINFQESTNKNGTISISIAPRKVTTEQKCAATFAITPWPVNIWQLFNPWCNKMFREGHHRRPHKLSPPHKKNSTTLKNDILVPHIPGVVNLNDKHPVAEAQNNLTTTHAHERKPKPEKRYPPADPDSALLSTFNSSSLSTPVENRQKCPYAAYCWRPYNPFRWFWDQVRTEQYEEYWTGHWNHHAFAKPGEAFSDVRESEWRGPGNWWSWKKLGFGKKGKDGKN